MYMKANSDDQFSYVSPEQLLVFTDLDGTLLDHDNYSAEAALPTIARLQKLAVPIIFVTSKTLVEVIELQNSLNLHHPFAVENGAAICIPADSALQCDELSETKFGKGRWKIALFGPSYPDICQHLCQIRNQQHFRFQGFSDMSDEELQLHTGLDRYRAKLAKQRLASEPLLWNDSDENLSKFKQALQALGLELTRGGRFYHVKAAFDKADAMAWLVDKYSTSFTRSYRSLALGDSENDRRMLEHADVAIVIPRKHDAPLEINRMHSILAPHPGPFGWSQSIEQILNTSIKGVNHG